MKLVFTAKHSFDDLSSAVVTHLGKDDKVDTVKQRYEECVHSIVSEEHLTFHVVAAPHDEFSRHVIPVASEPELAERISRLSGRAVGDLDCIVLLGRAFLDADLTSDEMAEVAAVDVAEHLNVLWPAFSEETWWAAPHLSWAAIAGVIVSGLPETQDLIIDLGDGMDETDVVERVCGRAMSSMIEERYEGPDAPTKFCQENGAAIVAVDKIAGQARASRGGGVSFPAAPGEIAAAGRAVAEAALHLIASPASTIH